MVRRLDSSLAQPKHFTGLMQLHGLQLQGPHLLSDWTHISFCLMCSDCAGLGPEWLSRGPKSLLQYSNICLHFTCLTNVPCD
ncbi:hypothetical protein GDO81_010733 [Engystomops pustulosus]|uniref:Uncharacterized protein n=1 Tax=Engystomops pustulosus TaxID=76066 RepID=A0AAV7C387_ENGPU|nr:hypothetical protein GDO81_010733 [Engystomops pustulosus]